VPSKTNSERIEDLGKLTSTLNLQVGRVESSHDKTSDALHELTEKFGRLDERVKGLEKKAAEPSLDVDQGRLDERVRTLERNADKRGDRRFTVWMMVLSSLVTIAVSVGVIFLKTYLDQKH